MATSAAGFVGFGMPPASTTPLSGQVVSVAAQPSPLLGNAWMHELGRASAVALAFLVPTGAPAYKTRMPAQPTQFHR
jgi:hypothetical protein